MCQQQPLFFRYSVSFVPYKLYKNLLNNLYHPVINTCPRNLVFVLIYPCVRQPWDAEESEILVRPNAAQSGCTARSSVPQEYSDVIFSSDWLRNITQGSPVDGFWPPQLCILNKNYFIYPLAVQTQDLSALYLAVLSSLQFPTQAGIMGDSAEHSAITSEKELCPG